MSVEPEWRVAPCGSCGTTIEDFWEEGVDDWYCTGCWPDIERDRLRGAVKNLLAIIDSPEWKGTEVMAHVHGYGVSKEIGERNHKWIEEARALLPPSWK